MSDRYESRGAALIQFYGWLRETGEIDRLVDLVIEKVRDARQTERPKDSETAPAGSRLAAALDALRRSDELLSWITFDDGVPNVWPEEAVISACRTYNEAALAGGGR